MERVRVLVTGSAGYIGAVLCPFLAAAGPRRRRPRHRAIYDGCDFGPYGASSGSTSTSATSAEHLEGFDAIVHLAALSNDPLGDLSPELTYEINHHATVSLARAAKDAGVGRFVFASSCSMYGAADGDALLAEDAPLRPLTPYAESKVRSEEALVGLDGDGFTTVSMRNATVYGVSPRLRLDVVLNNLAAWSHVTGQIRLLSDGMSWRPLLHVRDLAKVAAQDARGARHRSSADVRSTSARRAQNYLVRDLAEMLADVTGCEVEFAGDASPDPRSYRVDFSALGRAFPDLELDWDARSGRRGARRRLPRRSASPRRRSRAARTSGFGSCGTCSTSTRSTPTFAGPG